MLDSCCLRGSMGRLTTAARHKGRCNLLLQLTADMPAVLPPAVLLPTRVVLLQLTLQLRLAIGMTPAQVAQGVDYDIARWLAQPDTAQAMARVYAPDAVVRWLHEPEIWYQQLQVIGRALWACGARAFDVARACILAGGMHTTQQGMWCRADAVARQFVWLHLPGCSSEVLCASTVMVCLVACCCTCVSNLIQRGRVCWLFSSCVRACVRRQTPTKHPHCHQGQQPALLLAAQQACVAQWPLLPGLSAATSASGRRLQQMLLGTSTTRPAARAAPGG